MINRILSLFLGIGILISSPFAISADHQIVSPKQGIHLVKTDTDGIVLELVASEYQLAEETLWGRSYQQIYIAGADRTTQAGLPALPVFHALLGAPPGTQVEVELLENSQRTIPLKFPLVPAPLPLSHEKDLMPGEYGYSDQLQALIQTPTDRYPQQPVQIGDDAWLRDQRILRIDYHPFQYDPESGVLVWNWKLQVRIRFQPHSAISQTSDGPSQESLFENVFRQNLLNYQQARSFRANTPLLKSYGVNASEVNSFLGPRYRVPVSKDGLYRLTYENLQAAGLDVGNVDPTTFQLHNQGSEVAIYVENLDGNGHQFSPGEFILFYGQAFSGERMAQRYSAENTNWLSFIRHLPEGGVEQWKPQMNATMVEKYNQENVYWLTEGGAPGRRMMMRDGTPLTAPTPTSYLANLHAEKQRTWRTTLFTGEDTWFWSLMSAQTTTFQVFTTTITAIASEPFTATLRGELSAFEFDDTGSPDHHTKIFFNDPAHLVPLDDRYWDGRSRYHFEVPLAKSKMVEGSNRLDVMALRVYQNPNKPIDYIYFDWFEVDYLRRFQAVNDEIFFPGEQAGAWKYVLNGFSNPPGAVLDITDVYTPTMILSSTYMTGTVSFEVNQFGGEKYLVGKFNDIPAAQISHYAPPDLAKPADYLFISHRDFITATQVLADYRAGQGLATQVIDVQDLYNEFNDGIYHPLAIKNYLAYAFANWPIPPAYVMLVGDGHWNFNGSTLYDSPPIYMPPNLAWVDPWQGEVDSPNLLATVVGGDVLPDLSISRVPVNSAAQMEAIVDKILAYEGTSLQDWQLRILSVADNGPDSAGDFRGMVRALNWDYFPPSTGYITDTIFLDTFIQTGACAAGSPCPAAATEIVDTLNLSGTLLMDYVGHASLTFWAREKIFSTTDGGRLTNSASLPVMLSMTCLDGYWSHPNLSSPSLAEELLRIDGRGLIAAFSPTGLGVATGHDPLQRGFYDALFRNGEWGLGKASLAAKMALYATGADYDLIQTFTIFGDPALRLKNSFNFHVFPNQATKNAKQGTTVIYPVQVTNTARITDTLEVAASGNNWTVTVPAVIGPLASGASVQVDVAVQIPRHAPSQAQDEVRLVFISLGNRTISHEVILTTTTWNKLWLPELAR